MREIEFRAWLKNQKQMVRVKTICLENKGTIIVYDTIKREGVFLFDEIELIQYTGLKDKNGVKIFEGDIVKVYGRTFDNVLMCAIAKVVYLDSQFALYMHNQYFAIYSDSCSNYEVIGNIYENKELLEEKNERRN